MAMRLGIVSLVFIIGLDWVVGSWAAESPGRQKAQHVCAACHGIDGIAKNPDAPNLAGDSPNYIEKQLKAFRSGERKQEQMSIIAKGLEDQDIRDVAKWYSSLRVRVEMPE
jgi:cytochrome c553